MNELKEIIQLPLLTSAMLVVTHRCCMSCRYCFVKQENCDMTYEMAQRAVDFLIANAKEMQITPRITFFGGEPLLLWNEIIKPLTLYIRETLKTPFELSITTNGILLTDEILSFMKQYNIGLLFSIDGDKETQDYNRPLKTIESSFDTLEDRITKIIKVFPNTTFRSTIIPYTCHLTWNNIKFAINKGYRSFYTVPNIYEEWTDEKKEILREQLHHYSEYFVDCFRHGKRPISFTSMEEAMKKINTINSAVKLDNYRTHFSCTAKGKCGLGSGRYCAISYDGNIYGCQEMTSNDGINSPFYIGSINEGVNNNRRLALMQSYNPIKVQGLDCLTCQYNRVCDGGCVANNYMIEGNININPKVFCWWKQLLLSESEWIVNILGEEQNLKFRDYWVGINNGRNK